MTDTQVTNQDPVKKLLELNKEEKYFLQITALLDGKTPREELFRIMKALPMKTPGSTPWDPDRATETLRKLRNLGLIDNHNRCHPQINEIVARRPLERRALDLCHQLIRSSYIDNHSLDNDEHKLCQRTLRNFRLALYSHDLETLQKYLPIFYRAPYDSRFRHPFASLVLYPFDPQWFVKLPLHLQFTALDDCITHALEDLVDTPELDRFIVTNYPADKSGSRPFILLYAHKLLLSGRLPELAELCHQHHDIFSGSGFAGALAASQGNFSAGNRFFNQDLESAHLRNPEGRACFDAPIAFFYILATGQARNLTSWMETATTLAAGARQFAYNPFTRDLFHLADTLLKLFQGLTSEAEKSFAAIEKRPLRSIFTLLQTLVSYWLSGQIDSHEQENLRRLQLLAGRFFPWIEIECNYLLQLEERSATTEIPTPTAPPETTAFKPLSPSVTIEPAWRRTLTALKQLTPKSSANECKTEPEKKARLAWFISYNSPGELSLTPKIQKALSDKSWSPGRNLALGRVFAGEHFNFFTLQDHQIFQSLLRQTDDKGETFTFEQSRAIPALSGHPYLFLNGRDQIPASLQAGQTRIMVDKNAADGEISLQIYPEFNGRDFMVVEETSARFTFYRNNHQLEEIARLLGRDGSAMPPEAEPEIPDLLESLLPLLPVHSNLPLTSEGSAPAVSEAQLFLQIFPAGDGLRFELTSKPLGPQGPQLRPGEGKKYLYAKIDEKTCAVNRDLELEKERRHILLAACPGLGEDNAQACWQITEIERCLQILHEIRILQKRLPDEAAWLICEWPAGRKLGLKEKPGPSALRFRIKPHQEWFKIEGELLIDEKETLNLRELLQSMKKKQGQFLPLADNHFITLTEDLQRRIQELSFYLNHEGGELLIHKAATAKVAEILGDLPKVEASHSWHEQLQRFKEAENFKPEIPSTLQAELRSYQKEGFSWLARLAHLGFGACLADDMGLGKTVQTLTLILSRAARGPALVVAPTSVCANWHKECERFAPILNPIQFGGNDRQELLDKIKPYDLLICSYTMLQQEKKMFAAREWEIIVLDEAQAIKNLNTKRSQAAMSLRGRFRLTTTGTPIENHLGELWNLFQFINPGLLGSLDQFNQRFAIPIEQENNTEARLLLQKIIQPYILRRHKNQVLRELPPRTEIVLQVEMSEAERNFYEAVRRQAIDRLEEADTEENQNRGGTSIQVLAELTRLRLAACNPRLVLPESTIESAKLKHCGRIIDDLLAGGHQALIFSQFVKHLELVRAYFDKKKIAYRYLDGSTPKTRRQAEISAFQEGQAHLFLISLKAGGLGLNLTAADYVLHLDPWWNPAIEDQASDRAHRIGQNRPVTVYRLISRDTIEEKIVRLHQEKRNLADQILSASDQSARFTTGELLKLIKEG